MSDSSLQWNFHDDPTASPEGHEPDRPAGPAFPWRRIAALLLIGALLLGLAGLAGFGFGRFQRSTTAARADLQATLDLETWTWQSGNRQLLTSTLDPQGRIDWRRELERQFDATGKEIRSVNLRSFRFVDDTLVQAELDVTDSHGVHPETRYYRLVQNQWRRTAPPSK